MWCKGSNITYSGSFDYYPFGMMMVARQYLRENVEGYRYAFNGKEKDDEGMGGDGVTYDYGFRIYNPALGRFLSVDPLTKEYPWYTPYQFAGNMPIWAIDLDGLEEKKITGWRNFTQVHIRVSVGMQGGINFLKLGDVGVKLPQVHLWEGTFTRFEGQDEWTAEYNYPTKNGLFDYSVGASIHALGTGVSVEKTYRVHSIGEMGSNVEDLGTDVFVSLLYDQTGGNSKENAQYDITQFGLSGMFFGGFEGTVTEGKKLAEWDEADKNFIKPSSEIPIQSLSVNVPASTFNYTIKRGDTLSEIAQSFSVDLQELGALNGIKKLGDIKAGEKLMIPQPLPNTN